MVNPNTVAKAYGELVRDGLVQSRPGRGYFVADRRQVYSEAERLRRLSHALAAFLSEALVLDFTPDELRTALDAELSRIETGLLEPTRGSAAVLSHDSRRIPRRGATDSLPASASRFTIDLGTGGPAARGTRL